MNLPPQTADRTRRINGNEIAILGLLVLIGIAGGLTARRQWAELKSAHAATVAERSREITALGAENDNLLRRDRVQAEQPASTLPNAALSAGLTTESRSARAAALLSLARILTRGSGGIILRLEQQSQQSLMRSMAQLAIRGARVSQNIPPTPAYQVGSDYQLSPRFGELFGIGDQEVARMQQALTRAHERLDELTVAKAAIQDQGDGSYLLTVGGLPDSETSVERDRMIGTFKEVLGEDGYRAFALLNGEMETPAGTRGGPSDFFASSFSSIQTSRTFDRTITISKNGRGGYIYDMQSSGKSIARGGAASLPDLQERLGAGVKLLPAGF